jgi:hypothetical protein
VVEGVPKTAPKGAVFCRLTSGTETYAVFLSSAVEKHVFKYISEASGFRVEDQDSGLIISLWRKFGAFTGYRGQ